MLNLRCQPRLMCRARQQNRWHVRQPARYLIPHMYTCTHIQHMRACAHKHTHACTHTHTHTHTYTIKTGHHTVCPSVLSPSGTAASTSVLVPSLTAKPMLSSYHPPLQRNDLQNTQSSSESWHLFVLGTHHHPLKKFWSSASEVSYWIFKSLVELYAQERQRLKGKSSWQQTKHPEPCSDLINPENL